MNPELSKINILCIIPARGGSKGIPNKNIKIFIDKPLIAHTINVANKSKSINQTIVSTDSEEIAAIARSYGGIVPFIRPHHLAEDESRAIDVIIHALKTMEINNNTTYELIVYLEPTTPNRLPEDVENAINLFLQSNADSLASIVEATQYHPILMKKVENNLLLPFCIEEPEGMPRQLYNPKAFMRNGAVYIFRRSNILSRIMWGKTIIPYIMPIERSSCIDDLNDWILAEHWYKVNNNLL